MKFVNADAPMKSCAVINNNTDNASVERTDTLSAIKYIGAFFSIRNESQRLDTISKD